jgi:TctA family transporter
MDEPVSASELMEALMSNGLYALGYLVVILGVAYIAHLMHIPQAWIVGIVVVLIGLGIVTVSQNMKAKS